MTRCSPLATCTMVSTDVACTSSWLLVPPPTDCP
uniref:Uncharacterized protein n=1 Tax=Arundo donax TaxID=35708 RepID=A0A0A8Y562_ARUDO